MQTKHERKRRKERRRKLRRIRKRAKLIAAAVIIAISPMSVGAPISDIKPQAEGIIVQEGSTDLPAYLKQDRLPTIEERYTKLKEEAQTREKLRKEEEARKAAEDARKAAAKLHAEIAAENRAAQLLAAEKKRKAQEAERIKNSSRDSRGTIRGTNGNRRLMSVTAYTAGYESTQKRKGEAGYGITASGTTVSEGRTLACGPSLPFGTRVDIPSMGISGVCEDRGGAITDSHIDVYVADLARAQKFGRKSVEVIVH